MKAYTILQISILLLLMELAACNIQLFCSSQGFVNLSVDAKWRAFKPVCYGGSGKYWYHWFNVPYSWNSLLPLQSPGYKDFIFIPKSVQPGRYEIGLNLYDIRYEVEMPKYITLDIDRFGFIKIFIRDQSTALKPMKNFKDQDLFTFPTQQKIQMLITDGDTKGILQIISRIVEADNPCQQKQQFFTKTLASIRQFISQSQNDSKILQKQLTDLNSNLQVEKKKIQQLQKQKTEENNNNNNEQKIKQEQAQIQESISFLTKRVESFKEDQESFRIGIEQLSGQLMKFKEEEVQTIKGQILLLNLVVTDLTGYINEGIGESEKWELELMKVLNTLAKKKEILMGAEAVLETAEEKIASYQQSIETITTYIQNDEKEIRKFGIMLEEVAKKINEEASKNLLRIDSDITGQEEKVMNLEVQLVMKEAEIKKRKESDDSLKSALSEFQIIISRSYESCPSAAASATSITSTSPEEVQKKYSGYMEQKKFKSYVQSVWGIYPQEVFPRKDSVYYVYNINLFSPTWKSTYSVNSNYLQNYYDHAFTCTKLASRPSQYGTISDIRFGSIKVTDSEDNDWQLNFSSCSSMQSASGVKFPREGDWILWNGSQQRNSNQFNVRSALCV